MFIKTYFYLRYSHRFVSIIFYYFVLFQINITAEFPSKSGTCIPGAPYSDEFDFHDKVFVVAETDDTHIYHLHLGNEDTYIIFLFVSLNNIPPEVKGLTRANTTHFFPYQWINAFCAANE